MRTLERITVTGYKSIKELRDFELSDLNVLIGANGAGKSNLLSVFKMLDYMANNRLQLFVGQSGGADSLLHYGRKKTAEIRIELDTRTFKNTQYNYKFSLSPAIPNKLIFSSERCIIKYNSSNYEDEDSEMTGGYEEMHRDHPNTETPLQYILRQWKTYHFQDTTDAAKVKQNHSIYDNETLNMMQVTLPLSCIYYITITGIAMIE